MVHGRWPLHGARLGREVRHHWPSDERPCAARYGDADRGSSPLSITEIPQLTAGVGARW